jgi:hypothetical protein
MELHCKHFRCKKLPAFASAKELKSHVQCHATEPVICSSCRKVFLDRVSFDRYERRISNIDTN